MKELFYTEGYGETAFIESFLRSRSCVFTTDIAEVFSGSCDIYIRNCKSDSAIKPAILSEKWLIEKVSSSPTKLWIIADLESIPCYTKFKVDMQTFLAQEGLSVDLVVVNSKPKLEYEYFQDLEHLKQSVLAMYNEDNPQSLKSSSNQLNEVGILTNTGYNEYVRAQVFCRKNLNSFPKRRLAQKYFSSLHAQMKGISLSDRVSQYLDQQLVLDTSEE